MNKNWGYCDIDLTPCFGAGTICKKSPNKHFTKQDNKPLRNKNCSRYKKEISEPSEYEKT